MPGRIARNRIWELVERQHGVISRAQLLALGVSASTIDRRLAGGRLHSLWRGIYAVGRPRVTRPGWWLAAVLACGEGAVLSHLSAAELWGIRGTNTGTEREVDRPAEIHVSVPSGRIRRLGGIVAFRRRSLEHREITECDGVPVTDPGRTLVDLASLHRRVDLEAAVNAADRLGLIDPERLRGRVEESSGMNGVKSLRRILDRRTFALTDSELERRFLRVVRRAQLPIPKTQQRVQGFRVDFFWPELLLVVETDGLRYHRTASQQTKDRIRDQVLTAAGFKVLRFTHAQVRYQPDHVLRTLRAASNPISMQ